MIGLSYQTQLDEGAFQTAGGADPQTPVEAISGTTRRWYSLRPRELPSLEDYWKFRGLLRDWKAERGPSSSTTKIVNCESYRKIIAMGPKAIPLLLRQLQEEPDFWFAALRALADADPVPDDARGNLRRMADAWLNWGVQNGYIVGKDDSGAHGNS